MKIEFRQLLDSLQGLEILVCSSQQHPVHEDQWKLVIDRISVTQTQKLTLFLNHVNYISTGSCKSSRIGGGKGKASVFPCMVSTGFGYSFHVSGREHRLIFTLTFLACCCKKLICCEGTTLTLSSASRQLKTDIGIFYPFRAGFLGKKGTLVTISRDGARRGRRDDFLTFADVFFLRDGMFSFGDPKGSLMKKVTSSNKKTQSKRQKGRRAFPLSGRRPYLQ